MILFVVNLVTHILIDNNTMSIERWKWDKNLHQDFFFYLDIQEKKNDANLLLEIFLHIFVFLIHLLPGVDGLFRNGRNNADLSAGVD